MGSPVKPDKQANRDARGRFRKGQSGNRSGRPKVNRNKELTESEALLAKASKSLTRQLIKLGKQGNIQVLLSLAPRILPVRRESTLEVELPQTETAADFHKAASRVLADVANGNITPSEGASVLSIVQGAQKTFELSEFETRLQRIEELLTEERNGKPTNFKAAGSHRGRR